MLDVSMNWLALRSFKKKSEEGEKNLKTVDFQVIEYIRDLTTRFGSAVFVCWKLNFINL
jgi:hypothetical protein